MNMLADAFTVNVDLWDLAKVAPGVALVLIGIIHRKKLWANRKGILTAMLSACFLVPGVGGAVKWKMACNDQETQKMQKALPGPWLELYEQAKDVESPSARTIMVEKFCEAGKQELPKLSPRGLALLIGLVENSDMEADSRMASVSRAASQFIGIPDLSETQVAAVLPGENP